MVCASFDKQTNSSFMADTQVSAVQANSSMAESDQAPNKQDRDKPFLAALAGHVAERPPFWLMRQAGRYLPEYMELRKTAGSFLDLAYNPEFAIEVTLQPLRRFGMDAAILFSDILVIPHALGQHLEFVQGEGPKLDPVRDRHALARLSPDKLHNHLEPVYQTVSGVRAKLDADKALIGFAGAPWTVATYMVEGGSSRDFAHTKRWAYARPDEFARLIELLVDATSQYLIAQVEHGAEALQIFDSWAGALPPDAFERWVIAPTRKIVQNIRKACPDTPVIGFPRGAGVMLGEYARQTGVTALSLDTAMKPGWAKAETDLPLQGNMDPVLLLNGGQAMDDAARRIIDEMRGRAFIFNLGHGVIKETPPAHVARLAEVIRGG